MYAIIEASGRQFKVTNGQTLKIEHVLEEGAKTLTFDRVLMIGGEGEPKVGTPTVEGATVSADVVGTLRGPKIDVVNYRRRKGYERKVGYRADLVEVKITGINA